MWNAGPSVGALGGLREADSWDAVKSYAIYRRFVNMADLELERLRVLSSKARSCAQILVV